MQIFEKIMMGLGLAPAVCTLLPIRTLAVQSTRLALCAQEVFQTSEVQGVGANEDLVPFAKGRSSRIRQAGLHRGSYTPVYVGGHQHGPTHLVRQTPDAFQRLNPVPVGQPDHPRGVLLQLVGTQCPRGPVHAQDIYFVSPVVHVLSGHVAPAQRFAVGNNIPGNVDDLQHLQKIRY